MAAYWTRYLWHTRYRNHTIIAIGYLEPNQHTVNYVICYRDPKKFKPKNNTQSKKTFPPNQTSKRSSDDLPFGLSCHYLATIYYISPGQRTTKLRHLWHRRKPPPHTHVYTGKTFPKCAPSVLYSIFATFIPGDIWSRNLIHLSGSTDFPNCFQFCSSLQFAAVLFTCGEFAYPLLNYVLSSATHFYSEDKFLLQKLVQSIGNYLEYKTFFLHFDSNTAF